MRRPLAIFAALLVAGTMVQAADFNDNDYHEYILYDVDTPNIDVLIVPPVSPYYARDLVNIEKSVQAWDDGINAIGPSWLADGVNIRAYTLGYDTPTPEALADPEIIIFSAEYNPVLLFGIGLASPVTWCHGIGFGEAAIEWHQHEQSPWAVAQAECSDGGFQCTVINTNFFWLPDQENEINMYDLNQHELGHCLGVGHVGDALDFSANNFPEQDIMSYQHNPAQVHCVSNLNIKALSAVYGDMLGHPELQQDAGSYVHMSAGQYSHVDCLNPGTNWLDLLAPIPVGHEHPAPGSTLNGGGGDPGPDPEPAPAPAALTADKGTKGKNSVVDLAWTSGGGSVDVYVNGAIGATVANSGSYTDNLGKNPSGTYTYKVCNAGTSDCSNNASVVY